MLALALSVHGPQCERLLSAQLSRQRSNCERLDAVAAATHRVRAAEKRKRQMVRFAPPRNTVRPLGTRSLRVINRYWHQPDSSGSLGNARVIERNSSLGWRRARV